MNNLSPSTQATLLLTSSFSKHARNEEQPLSAYEWGIFAAWLHEHKMKPDDLLEKDFEEKLLEWSNDEISLIRIKSLLNRGAALALAVEKWQRIGLWVITRSDKEYPQSIKRKLKHLSPPIMYGIGNKDLLNVPTIAVLGSKKATQSYLENAYELGKKVASDGLALVSSGDKGINEIAMKGTLDNGGKGIVILAEELLKNSLSAKYRNALLQNSLLLISPYYPESLLSATNTIEADKYIYTLSTASIVMPSNSDDKTWSAANEVLENNWVPLWIPETFDLKGSSKQLIDKGAHTLTADQLNSSLSNLQLPKAYTNHTTSLFSSTEEVDSQEVTSVAIAPTTKGAEFDTQLTLYDFFIYKLKSTYGSNSIFKPKDIENLLELKPVQITEWLQKAETDNLIEKLDGRVRKYMLKEITE